jgi:hypothetical protein
MMMAMSAALAGPGTARGVVLGQVDDFEDGTPQAWVRGAIAPNPPINVPDGGPAGVGDNYLQNVSFGGLGANSRQVMFNSLQWTGDYLGSGVTVIEADMANFGTTALSMRIAIQNGLGTQFGSTISVALPADGVWRAVSFGVRPADLTLILGTSTVEDVLSDVIQLRILSAASTPAWVGDVIVSTLGVDNITATTEALPLPALSVWAQWVLAASLLLIALGSGPNRRRAVARARPGAFVCSPYIGAGEISPVGLSPD